MNAEVREHLVKEFNELNADIKDRVATAILIATKEICNVLVYISAEQKMEDFISWKNKDTKH